MSRFLLRRSRYAYCSDFSTALRAMWMQLFARPLKPCRSGHVVSASHLLRNQLGSCAMLWMQIVPCRRPHLC